jgi:hypothetical protein
MIFVAVQVRTLSSYSLSYCCQVRRTTMKLLRPGRVLRLVLLPLLCLMAADTCQARPQEQSISGNIQRCSFKLNSHRRSAQGQGRYLDLHEMHLFIPTVTCHEKLKWERIICERAVDPWVMRLTRSIYPLSFFFKAFDARWSSLECC